MSPKISEAEKQQRRSHIMKAAYEVFKHKGYEAATMQDIVVRTGMSRGWVYLYFSSKEEIFRAWMEANDADILTRLQHMIEDDSQSVWGAVQLLFAIQMDALEETDDGIGAAIYEYFLGGREDEARLQYLRERYTRMLQQTTALYEKGWHTGEFTGSSSPAALTQMTIVFFDGLALHVQGVGAGLVQPRVQLELFLDSLRGLLGVQS